MAGSNGSVSNEVLHIALKFANTDKCMKNFYTLNPYASSIQVGTLYCIFVEEETEIDRLHAP